MRSGPRRNRMSSLARKKAPAGFPARSDHESSTFSILSRDQRHDLLTRYFAHHDRPTDSPDQRAAALGAWLDAAVAAVPAARPDDIVIAAPHDMPPNRCKLIRVAAVPDIGLVSCLVEVLRPSGRFDALVDMGNPVKGVILFPYLQRRVEGRALRAMAPAASLELCRTVAEAVVPRRWPGEVRCMNGYECLIFLIVLIFVLRCFLTGARRVGSHRGFAGCPTRPIPQPVWPGLDPRRCLSPRGGQR